MTSAINEMHSAGEAFDSIADEYDSLFTDSLIGRLQRQAVWRQAERIFQTGDRVLELNCGTGEDALFLVRKGISVCACDASKGMIERARKRKAAEAPGCDVEFRVLATEDLQSLPRQAPFDGVFSNFSGLNCVFDLAHTTQVLAQRVRLGAQLLLCLSSRFCAWEIFYYSLRGEFRKAFRRTSGLTKACVSNSIFRVYYPTLNGILRAFQPVFRLRSITGIAITVPPSYLESWARRNPRLVRMCGAVDRLVCQWPGIRVLGDHMLLHLERAR
jgi:SAM-dependent methyltransferase